MYIHRLPQESENQEKTAETQLETESLPQGEAGNCPFCNEKIYWVNMVPIEPNGTVHLAICNMGRF